MSGGFAGVAHRASCVLRDTRTRSALMTLGFASVAHRASCAVMMSVKTC
jgi:hypothetical protein